MSKVKRIKKIEMFLDDGANMPVRGHSLDAGLDLRTKESIIIPAHGSTVIDTGVHFRIPEGWFGKLESKSGLNVNKQVFCGGGVIDSGFTGPIKCRLYNFSDEDYVFAEGDKCVQIVFLPISTPELVEVVSTDDWVYERGNSGYGSTGK